MGTRLRERRVEANGISFALLEAGDGPLALCLHGFPDSARTWRRLLPALADAGFRAVAPYMRGYAPSGLAPDGAYGLRALAGDAIGLHEALSEDERAVLIGHDWGAEAAYGAAALAPGRWRRLVTLGVPPLSLDSRLFGDYGQLKRFFYLFLFKTPEAEAVVAADDFAFIDRLWQDWSPGYDSARDARWAKDALSDPAHLSAALGYYRAEEPGLDPGGPDAALLAVPPQPTLYLHGDRDGSVGVDLVRDAESYLSSGSRFEVILNTGHFPHLEQPAQVNARILDWVSPSPGEHA